MNQIDMIDIQRRVIQIVDIKRQTRRIEHDDREETKKECHSKGGNLQALR